MQFEWRDDASKIFTAVVLLILGGALSACTVLGTGRSTLVLADPLPYCDNCAPMYSGSEFKHLIVAPCNAAPCPTRLIGLQGEDPHTPEQWETFKKKKRLSTDANVASIDINVRDQSNTPALEFFNIQTANASDIIKVLIDPNSNQNQKEKQLYKFRYSYLTMPEADLPFVSQGYDDVGNKLYYYFPRITIDLTSTLNTAETLDRFDYIAAAIRIPADTEAKFINFSPKAADLLEFTLGQFKQTAAAKASANTSNKVTTNAITGNNSTGAAGTGTSVGGEIGYGASVDFTLTDELTRDIKSSLEARSAGIMQNGKLFLIELRSNEQKHISGTYTFNVMLQVPSTPEDKTSQDKTPKNKILNWSISYPTVKSITAEVRIVGIVRHVIKPGKTISFERVPEPLNDEIFRQVVLFEQQVPLWKFSNSLAGDVDTNLTVYSNIKEASFIVLDETGCEALGQGTGREFSLSINYNKKVNIVFLPVIVDGAKSVILNARDVSGITLGKHAYAIGNYMPTPEPTSIPTCTLTSKPTPTSTSIP